MDRWQATFETAYETGDWDPMRATCAAGLLFDDRRRLALLSGDLELMITSARVRVEMGARPQLRLVGTAGERIAVSRVLWSGGPSDGPFEIEYVGLFEVDEAGQHTAMVLFDCDDERAAQREAWARWAAIDPTVTEVTSVLGEVIDSWNTKDVERLRAVCAEDLVVEDHRRTGTGRSEGRDAYVQSVVALWELAPESRFEAGWFWLAIAPNVSASSARRSGTVAGGGEFESDFLVVVAVAQGRTTRLDVFEIDATEAALARFEELCPDASRS
jgi:ketosteroid isomerase-like protein